LSTRQERQRTAGPLAIFIRDFRRGLELRYVGVFERTLSHAVLLTPAVVFDRGDQCLVALNALGFQDVMFLAPRISLSRFATHEFRKLGQRPIRAVPPCG